MNSNLLKACDSQVLGGAVTGILLLLHGSAVDNAKITMAIYTLVGTGLFLLLLFFYERLLRSNTWSQATRLQRGILFVVIILLFTVLGAKIASGIPVAPLLRTLNRTQGVESPWTDYQAHRDLYLKSVAKEQIALENLCADIRSNLLVRIFCAELFKTDAEGHLFVKRLTSDYSKLEPWQKAQVTQRSYILMYTILEGLRYKPRFSDEVLSMNEDLRTDFYYRAPYRRKE